MRNFMITITLVFFSATACFAQTDLKQGSTETKSIESLQLRVAVTEANVHDLANELRTTTSESRTLDNFEASTKRLLDQTRRLFDLQSKLHLLELADAEGKIAKSRQRIAERQTRADEIVLARVKELLEGKLNARATTNDAADTKQELEKMLQGRWKVERYHSGDEEENLIDHPMEIVIEGQIMRMVVGARGSSEPIQLRIADATNEVWQVDFVHDPNGDGEIIRGIVQVDETSLRICMGDGISDDKAFLPQAFVPGKRVNLFECSRANIGKSSNLLGKWQTKLYVNSEGIIINGRLVDPDHEWEPLEETIPREELLAGPWVMEIGEESLSIQHATARLPLLTLPISNIGEETFDVSSPKRALEDPLAAFGPDLTTLQLCGRFSIDGDALKLCVSEVDEKVDVPPLSPNADLYFECIRVSEDTETVSGTLDSPRIVYIDEGEMLHTHSSKEDVEKINRFIEQAKSTANQ